MLKRIVIGAGLLGIACLIAFLALAWRPVIAPIDPPDKASFPADLIAKGKVLAGAGYCAVCHTRRGGPAFAGGLGMRTPFGTIYSPNITPEPETGIGRWSLEAFTRAMHEGVSRDGSHLFPAFPYDHFTKISDDDVKAIYAYMMTRPPVRAEAPANTIPFPLNIRLLQEGWKILFFRSGRYRPDASKSAEWNRGAYLAESLSHCGGCHTPRNQFGAEDKKRHFAGGEAEGWVSYAISASSPAPTPWDKEALVFFLRHGWHEKHGVSRGPMAEVTGNLAGLPENDINAIAAYVASEMGEPETRPEAVQAAGAVTITAAARNDEAQGAQIYQAACATCHESGRPLPFGGLDFRFSTAVNSPTPQNIVNVTLFGLPPADGEASPVMPAFRATLSDRQIANLLAYMRRHFSSKPAWDRVAEMVRKTRSGEHKVAIRPADSIERAPENVGAKE